MDEFEKELEEMRRRHAEEFGGQVMGYSPSLCIRIVEYVRAAQKRGFTVAQLAARLQIPLPKLRSWLYVEYRNRELRPQFSTGNMRPVQVRAKVVTVCDGVAERRFSIRSRSGWQVKELTIDELLSILRSLH